VKFATSREDDARNLKAFGREIEAYLQFDHPAIVKLLNYGVPILGGERPFLELEFIPGGSLTDYLLSHAEVDLNVGFTVLLGIARAMEVLHRSNVVHRDLNPNNVLLDHDRRPYLSDYGFARSIDAATNLSRVGTLIYTAPEIVAGATYTASVDVWSFGMLLYSIATCRFPYNELRKPEFTQIHFDAAVQGALLDPTYSVKMVEERPLFGELFDRCTNRDPTQRPTFSEIAETLLRLAKQNETAYPTLNFGALSAYDGELTGFPRNRENGSWADVMEKTDASPLTIAVKGIMLYNGALGECNQNAAKSYLLAAYDQGSRLAKAELLQIQEETGDDFNLDDRPPSYPQMSRLPFAVISSKLGL
jgi:serine/threonine protein kinase